MKTFFDLNKISYYFIEIIVKVVFRILVFLIPIQVFCQQDFIRGNGYDDMYYCGSSNSKRIICRITEYGSKVDIKEYFGGLIDYAEPIEGAILGRMHHFIYKSEDAGTNFFQLTTQPMQTYTVCGGEIAGECTIFSYKVVEGKNENLQIYKSFDNGITQTKVKDSSDFFFDVQVGVESGEIYTVSLIDAGYYLFHSTDFGATFDTISINTTIFQQNKSKFSGISPGPQKGELYMISETNTCPVNHIYIYHSVDYGKTWTHKSEKTFDCGDLLRFNSGRAPGSFYILHDKSIYNDKFKTIEIYCSIDTGQTFNIYEHVLAHSITIPEKDIYPAFSIWPNPASQIIALSYQIAKSSEIVILIYDSLGQCVLHHTPSWEAGKIEETIDIEDLKQGLYSVQIQSAGSTIATCKFIISR